MSADNWTHCPRCSAARESRFKERQAEVDAAYGNLPIAEFDQLRALLEADRTSEPPYTFREDYEFYGAQDGVIYATYSGHCSECKLGVNFEHSQPFFPDGGAS